ncbi:MAG: hypothetical protein FJX39_08595 [Alphaproteobacteria bacterium]|nr:hypothetical protein [Alphaproteobacteria bacterium]
MSNNSDKSPISSNERSQRPLWIAVLGLVISLFSYSMNDLMIGDVVFDLGLFVAVIGIAYWILQPKHGL